MHKPITANTLFYGDNLDILRDYIPPESVDLIYLDPPFNSNRNYNVLFRDESGRDSEAQIEAFEDTWHWSHTAEETYHELVTESSDEEHTAEEWRNGRIRGNGRNLQGLRCEPTAGVSKNL